MKIILIAAISLDGFITRHDQPGSSFTSPEDKRYFRETVLQFETLLFGSATYETSKNWIASHLRPDQLKIVLTRNPARYSADARENEIEFTSATPAELRKALLHRGRQNIALLGGGKIYGWFLQQNAVDELWLTLEPRIFGSGTKLADTPIDPRLELLSCQTLGQSTLLLKYRPLPTPKA